MLSKLNRRQGITLAVITILLIAIPLVIYLVKQQQILKGRASVNSRLQFVDSAHALLPGDPPTTTTRNITLKIDHVGNTVTPPPPVGNPPPPAVSDVCNATGVLNPEPGNNFVIQVKVLEVSTIVPYPGVSNATVSIQGPSSATLTTNSQGIAAFTGLASGKYATTLTVPAGYSSAVVASIYPYGLTSPLLFQNFTNSICVSVGSSRTLFFVIYRI